jgi:hypothetical protein
LEVRGKTTDDSKEKNWYMMDKPGKRKISYLSPFLSMWRGLPREDFLKKEKE